MRIAEAKKKVAPRRVKASIVIPCYNEAENIPSLFSEFAEALEGNTGEIEIIFVDNGSTDKTRPVLERLLRKNRFARAVYVGKNRGYGHGILTGLKEARGELIGYMHGDLQVRPADAIKIVRGLLLLKERRSLFFKSRRLGRSFLQKVFTIGMGLYCSAVLCTWLSDINAQPTFFHESFMLTWKNPPEDFSLDLFVLALAVKERRRIVRWPVRVYGREKGNSTWERGIVSRLRLSLAFMKSAHRIRRNSSLA